MGPRPKINWKKRGGDREPDPKKLKRKGRCSKSLTRGKKGDAPSGACKKRKRMCRRGSAREEVKGKHLMALTHEKRKWGCPSGLTHEEGKRRRPVALTFKERKGGFPRGPNP